MSTGEGRGPGTGVAGGAGSTGRRRRPRGCRGRASQIARPESQPGARPLGGGWMPSTSTPLRARSQETTELEFHISPACNSSRPHTGVGTSGTRSSTRWATAASGDTRTGLSIAHSSSGMTPSRHRAFGDDAPGAAVEVGDRGHLDDEPPVGSHDLQRRVVQVAPRTAVEKRCDRFEHCAARPDHMGTGTQRQPIEVHAGGHRRRLFGHRPSPLGAVADADADLLPGLAAVLAAYA